MPAELTASKLDQPECLHAQVQLSCAPYFVLQWHGVAFCCYAPELSKLLIYLVSVHRACQCTESTLDALMPLHRWAH